MFFGGESENLWARRSSWAKPSGPALPKKVEVKRLNDCFLGIRHGSPQTRILAIIPPVNSVSKFGIFHGIFLLACREVTVRRHINVINLFEFHSCIGSTALKES